VSRCQLSLRRDDEVQAPKVHVHTQDLADAVTSHPRLDVDIETRKNPLPSMPLLVFWITG